VDPEVVFGRVRRRTFTPEELGRFLVACPAFGDTQGMRHVVADVG
jgi:hypothetical protein